MLTGAQDCMHTCWHAHMGWACPPFFLPLVQQGMHIAAHTGTEMAVKKACTIGSRNCPKVAKGDMIHDCAEGLFSRAQELVKGGQRQKQLWEANSYGVYRDIVYIGIYIH
jgi:hypothetical protein